MPPVHRLPTMVFPFIGAEMAEPGAQRSSFAGTVALALGTAGTAFGAYLLTFHGEDGEDHSSGGYPPVIGVLMAIVLPVGVVAAGLGIWELRQADVPLQQRSRAGLGILLGLLAVVIALIGTWTNLVAAWGPD